LGTDAVTTEKIAANAVNTVDITDSAVTNAKMADDSVGTTEIIDNSVTNAKMADDSINTTEIVSGAITTAKLSTEALVLRLGTGYAAGDTAMTGTMAFDADYSSGGETVTVTGMNSITSLMVVPSKGGYVFEIQENSPTAGSFAIKAMESTPAGGALVETSAGADLSAITGVRYQAIGPPTP